MPLVDARRPALTAGSESAARGPTTAAEREALNRGPALALLPGLAVLHHADTLDQAVVRRAVASAARPVLALPESCGVEVDDGLLSVVGPADAALLTRDRSTVLHAGHSYPAEGW